MWVYLYPSNTETVLKNAYIGEYDVSKIYMRTNEVRLPAEYQEVEYIQSNGTQYIDTWVYVNPDYTIEMKFEVTSDERYNTFFGTRTNWQQRYVWRTENVRNGVFFIQRSKSYTDNSYESYEWNFNVNQIYTLKMNQELYIDWSLEKTFSASTSSTPFDTPLALFALRYDLTTAWDFFYWKIYYCKLWDDSNNLIRDFVPCYRKSDSVIWMYDLVNDTFYVNDWTWTFTKWNDTPNMIEHLLRPIQSISYQEVEYIQSSWTQYIDTWLKHNPNTKVEIDLQFSNLTTQQRLFGSETTNSSYSTFVTYINWSWKRARATKDGEWNWQTTNVSADTNRHTFVLDKSTYKIYTNWSQIYSWTNNYSMTKNWQYNLLLLANFNTNYGSWTTPINLASAKLYRCKIWDNGTLVREFVPCYRTSDNEIWLIDTVNDVFYTNSWTWIFTKWPDV